MAGGGLLVTVRAIALILGGCMANNFLLEMLVVRDKGIGNLLTASQFLFTAVSAAVLVRLNRGDRPLALLGVLPRPQVPVAAYFKMTAIFATLSLVNNYAFAFGVSQPVHMVFRSASLLSTLTLGYFFFGHTYSAQKVAGVALASVGIFTVTAAEAHHKRMQDCPSCEHSWWPLGGGGGDDDASAAGEEEGGSLTTWLVGIAFLFAALFLSSYLGHQQQKTYEQYKAKDGTKDWREGLLYQHALSLPYFVLFAGDIMHHWDIVANSETVSLLPGVLPAAPLMIQVLALNLVTQLVCILGVYQLTAHHGTLACTFTLTIRKLLSLCLSIWWFQNPFSPQHWIGTAAVFAGALMFTLAPKPAPAPADDADDKKTK